VIDDPGARPAAFIPTVTISGTPQAMGEAHGETLREEIRDLVQSRTGMLMRLVPSATLDDVAWVSGEMWRQVQSALPALAREVEATARTAGVSPAELVVAGGYTDVCDALAAITRTVRTEVIDECTVAESSDPPFIVGTWDTHRSAVAALVLLRRVPDGGTETLALTTAGWPAQQGVNERGLAFAITNLTPRTAAASGLPYIAVNARLAESLSVRDFTEVATRLRYASGHSYLLVDASGAGVVLETSADAVKARAIKRLHVQANHYSDYLAVDDNGAYPYLRRSVERALTLRALLRRAAAPEALVEQIVASDVLYRNCTTPDVVTGAYFFLDPPARRMYCGTGTPVSGQWVSIGQSLGPRVGSSCT
jgi:hypothetical protein